MYKISLIEFIAIPAKGKIQVVVEQLKKKKIKYGISGMQAEGFIGIRKLWWLNLIFHGY